MDYSPYIIAAIVVVVGIVLYVKIHSQASSQAIINPVPPSAPATVAHVAAVQAEVKTLTDRIETASGIKAVAKRVEDLHVKIDGQRPAKEGGGDHDNGGEKKGG